MTPKSPSPRPDLPVEQASEADVEHLADWFQGWTYFNGITPDQIRRFAASFLVQTGYRKASLLSSPPATPETLGGKVDAFEALLKSISPVAAGAIAKTFAEQFPLPEAKATETWTPPKPPATVDDRERAREWLGDQDLGLYKLPGCFDALVSSLAAAFAAREAVVREEERERAIRIAEQNLESRSTISYAKAEARRIAAALRTATEGEKL